MSDSSIDVSKLIERLEERLAEYPVSATTIRLLLSQSLEALQSLREERDTMLEECCEAVIAAGFATGPAENFSELLSELLPDVAKLQKERDELLELDINESTAKVVRERDEARAEIATLRTQQPKSRCRRCGVALNEMALAVDGGRYCNLHRPAPPPEDQG